MMYPRPDTTRTKGTPHVCVKARNNVVGSQAPDLQSLHLRNQGNQDVSSLFVWQSQTDEAFFSERLFVGHRVCLMSCWQIILVQSARRRIGHEQERYRLFWREAGYADFSLTLEILPMGPTQSFGSFGGQSAA